MAEFYVIIYVNAFPLKYFGKEVDSMINLMILDDEVAELDCFSKMVDWESYGFELKYAVCDSQKAYDLINTEKIDVLITDIFMPHPNGLELAEMIYNKHPEMLIVFISAHSDFECAKKAFSYNVFAYITKPLCYEEIIDTLKKISKIKSKSTDSDEVLSLITCQQAMFDYSKSHIFTKEFSEIIIQCYPNAQVDDMPVASVYAKIDNFPEYLQNIWIYESERLYACIIRYLSDKNVVFVPVNYVYDRINFLVFPCKGSTDTVDFADHCQNAIDNFQSETAPVLRLKINIVLQAFYKKISDAKHAVNDFKIFYDRQENQKICETEDVIKKAVDFIEENYMNPISISDVSHAVYLSPFHFSRLFKNSTGETIANYVISVRLKKAAEMLISTDIAVGDIAKKVGYNSSAHFHKSFRYNYGITPKEYRMLHKKAD